MCLLITGPSHKLRNTLLNTPYMLGDIYKSNPDGVGIMYTNKSGLKITKALPLSIADARKFVETLPMDDRELAMHWRWKTHGDIDMINCHPYHVNANSAMMHNGILHTGNAADRSKSDTWHFIEDYLKTLDDDMLHNAQFAGMVAEFIGDNRFALMSADGRLTVINKDQGVEHDGMWFSNEYAWDSSVLIPGRQKAFSYKSFAGKGISSKGWSRDFDVDMDDGFGIHPMDREALALADDEDDELDYLYANIDESLEDCDVDAFRHCLTQMPRPTLEYVADNYEVVPYSRADDSQLDAKSRAMRTLLVDGDVEALLALLKNAEGAGSAVVIEDRVASCLLWYCETTPMYVGRALVADSITGDDQADDEIALLEEVRAAVH
jgi:hypothetical protein